MKKSHYGWFVTFGCGLVVFYGIGLAYNCFSLFLDPLMNKFALNKTAGALIANSLMLGGLSAMLLSGWAIGKFGARKVSFYAGIIISFGYAIFTIANHVFVCYIAAFIIGLGFGGGALIPVSIILTVWFKKKRGLALGLATMGSGIATIIAPGIIINAIECKGLDFTFLSLSGVVLCLSTVAFVLIRDLPSEKETQPYGGSLNKETENITGLTIKQALKDSKFYQLILATLLMGFILMPMIAHTSPMLIQIGCESNLVALLMSVFGVSMLVSKPFFGVVVDILGVYKSNIIVFLFVSLSIISGIFLDRWSIMPFLFVIFLGLGVPINTVSLPIWVSTIFGSKDMANIYSVVKMLFTAGGVLGGSLPGIIADSNGSYLPVFYVYIILIVVIFVIIQRLFAVSPNKGMRENQK